MSVSPSQDASSGALSLVLHAHLPFVRHPENPRHLEEEWLFEAIIETYLPLLDALDRLADEGVAYRLGISISPSLAEMLSDDVLQARFGAHLDRLIHLMNQEVARHGHDSPWHEPAHLHHRLFRRCRELYNTTYGRNLPAAFGRLQERGCIELLTSGATHGLLPLMATPQSQRAQLRIARQTHERHFGRPPHGLWMPESAYAPDLDQIICDAGFRYTFMDTHGLLFADPRPRYGVFRPVRTPAGLVALGRDVESSKQIWSRDDGYPGDPWYREFYRDLGFDGDYEVIRPYLHPDGVRRNLGVKYHRITGPVGLHEKRPYQPAAASERAVEHARHFLDGRRRQVRKLAETMDVEPVVVCPYDAELFGHWWFEGPQFLEHFLRLSAQQNELRLVLPGALAEAPETLQMVKPCPSSWGDQGYYAVWLNDTNEWIYPDLHRSEQRMVELAHRYDAPSDLQRRALNQAARELLLAQSSDWAFIMTSQSSVSYAAERTRDHCSNFNGLYLQLTEDRLEEPWISALEQKNNIFGDVDYRIYA
jgi:1,4-alpha-glucan branching enzyme